MIMQPSDYSPQPRFSPREPRQRFARSPYQNFPPHFYSPSAPMTQWSGGAVRSSSPRPPNYNQMVHRNDDSPSSDNDILDSSFIPLNLSGVSCSSGSSFGSSESPGSFADYSFHRPRSRGHNSNRKPHWSSYKSPNGGAGGRWSSSPNDFRRNRPYQEGGYSPNGGNSGHAEDIRVYISEEFLKDPWEHLQPKKPPDVTSPPPP